ncbi:MAG: ATP-dependent DNA helicase RecG [Tissierellia bacterium]|nr:ATP-dependent DNA helicase RecG [Tissierellia bacterium]
MLRSIKGIGPKKQELLNKIGIYDKEDLLNLMPIRYQDKRNISTVQEAFSLDEAVLRLKIIAKGRSIRLRGRKTITKLIATDGNEEINIIYFNDFYTPAGLVIGSDYYFFGKVGREKNEYFIYNPETSIIDDNFLSLDPIYPLTKGLGQKEMKKFVLEALKSTVIDPIPKDILANRKLIPIKTAHMNIHCPKSYEEINAAKYRLFYQETFILLTALNYLRYINDFDKKGPINRQNNIVEYFLDSLEFQLTEDQIKVVSEIISDMKSDKPMNRLLQGDVGSGKTIVALAAGVFSTANGHQTAFIAPTEVVANQHFKNHKHLLDELGFKSEILTGSTKAAQKDYIKKKLLAGDIDFIFGTHALIQEDVKFRDLGLVIADEQHKFGVKQRSQLISKGDNPDVLVMSATPIPRTLSLALYGDLNISSIKTKPKGRKKIITYALNKDYEKRIFRFIERQVLEGHQVYIVCPAIEKNEEIRLDTVYDIYERLSKASDIKSEVLHSRLKKEEKDAIIDDFKENRISVLISTTVIEVGVDVPNSSLIVIYNAERFGLSQIHQLRGRVGRGDVQSYCILICSSNSASARERMRIICENDDGYEIADRDLKMRGVGEILGSMQHGASIFDIDRFDGYENIIDIANEDVKYLMTEDPKLESPMNSELNRIVNSKIDNLINANSLN